MSQITDGQTYTSSYEYNLSGALVQETYPSGRVVKNEFESDGDLSRIYGKANPTAAERTYANSFSYMPDGRIVKLRLGNGLWESAKFNSRLQPIQIALGTVQNTTDKLKLEYGYGSAANNGNVLSQKITVNRPSSSPLIFDQTYTYDSLNRLKSAEEVSDSSTTWKQVYTFDRYGNRNFDEDETTTLLKACMDGSNPVVCVADRKVLSPEFNLTNNRMASGQDWTYDVAGNVTIDAEGRQFFYDAENKQKEVKNSLNDVIGQYFYDGDGKRVKKVVPDTGEVTIFVYDAGGKLIGEYSTQISQSPKVQYLTNDHLGSPRIITDENGDITSRTDYMPYGEEITGLGGRSPSDHYATDDIRQGFTGYEKDDETGLDYAQARMYAKHLGRFTGFDPVFITTERLIDPQRLHLYAYSRGNPLKYIDPDGRDIVISGSDEEKARKQYESFLLGLNSKDRKYVQFYVGEGKDGYAKGAFYVLVNKDHKSKSENFNALRNVANNREELVKATVLENGDSYTMGFYQLDDNTEVFTTATGTFENDFHGYALFQDRGLSNTDLSTGEFSEVLINGELTNVEMAATFFHEIRAHILLGDYGRTAAKGGHSAACSINSDKCTPTNASDREGRKAEEEARKNAKKK